MELSDFLDVQEVKNWKPESKVEMIAGFVFMVIAVAIIGVIIY